jgi:peroxiredoxin
MKLYPKWYMRTHIETAHETGHNEYQTISKTAEQPFTENRYMKPRTFKKLVKTSTHADRHMETIYRQAT